MKKNENKTLKGAGFTKLKGEKSIRHKMDQQILAYSHSGILSTNQRNEVHMDTKTWVSLPDTMCEGNQTKEHTLHEPIHVVFQNRLNTPC